MLYTFYFYDGTPTKERRPRKSANDGIIEENLNFDTDASALIYAAETVAEMNDDDFDYEFNDEQEALDYLDDIDIGSGAAFLFGLKVGGTFIYGDDDMLETMHQKEVEEALDDVKVNKSLDYKSQDKIIANNIEEFCNLLGIEYKRQWGAGLFYPTSWNVYREFKDMLRSAGLGNLPFYYYHPKHDKGDPNAIICVEDDGDENIEYVQVTANSEPIYASGYTPTVQIESVDEAVITGLDDVLTDPAFKEIIDLINSKYPSNDVKISKQSTADNYVDISIEFDMTEDLEDDMFYEAEEDYDEYDRPLPSGAYIKDIAVEDLAEDLEEKFLQNIPIEEDGMYACSNSDCKILVEILDNFYEGEPKIYREYTPATMYNSFGDPGDPAEYDYEIEGELVITLRVRLTKNV